MIIPHDKLSEQALDGVIESFVLQEGTDYGHRDWSIEQKKAQVLKQLQAGSAVIVFDPKTESCSIRPADQFA